MRQRFSASATYRGFRKYQGRREIPAVVNVNNVKDLIYSMNTAERQVLLEELQAFQSKSQAEKDQNCPPTVQQLRAIGIHYALPFVGFGFLDNFIMIIAGDYIDTTIGLTLGISTMAAAGLGNTLSDIAGIGSAWYVESLASRVGVHMPELTPTQLEMSSTQWSINMGRAIGITLGCLLGMLPLLFLHDRGKLKGGLDDNNSDTKPPN
ncbi:transmembrane protein 65-like [Limulus polyphemus]|uniref:Transmembrane protein 65-like n=1 Tax=Limulus polyphemus TaxID=6850 RepID=A0ABM1BTW6_LIMPO|nr:transmembrane protein 65-like [Limulus polyphemus]